LPVVQRAQFMAMSPQSTSLSLPSLTPLVQLAAWHSIRKLPVESPSAQIPPAQSLHWRQALPAAHRGQVSAASPQSTSTSAPFLTPSGQAGA